MKLFLVIVLIYLVLPFGWSGSPGRFGIFALLPELVTQSTAPAEPRLNGGEPFDSKTHVDDNTRAEVKLAAVRSSLESADGQKVGFVRIKQFSTSTADDVKAALQGLVDKGVHRTRLDPSTSGLSRPSTPHAPRSLDLWAVPTLCFVGSSSLRGRGIGSHIAGALVRA